MQEEDSGYYADCCVVVSTLPPIMPQSARPAYVVVPGGSKNNGSRPSHFRESSGSVARHVCKQLEAIDIVEKDPNG